MNENDDPLIIAGMKDYRHKRRLQETWDLTTERIPKGLNKLLKIAKAFSKIKLNDRYLPF